MAGSSSAAARMPFGRLGDAAALKRFASAFGLAQRAAIAGREVLDPVYARLPGRFPPLFEQLVTGYSWPDEVEAGPFRLLPNPAAADLAGLLEAMLRHPDVTEALLPAGFLPFAWATGVSAGPVCFDTGRRRSDRDCPVVRLDAEALRARRQAEAAEELAPSFRALIERLAG